MFQTNFVQTIKKHILCSILFDNQSEYEIMYRNTAEGNRSQIKI